MNIVLICGPPERTIGLDNKHIPIVPGADMHISHSLASDLTTWRGIWTVIKSDYLFWPVGMVSWKLTVPI